MTICQMDEYMTLEAYMHMYFICTYIVCILLKHFKMWEKSQCYEQ